MKYQIYKIQNNINFKYYIGSHICNCKEKHYNKKCYYFGGGTILKTAITKYGKHNFTKTILFEFDNFNDMDEMEMFIVDESFLKNPYVYNLCAGGRNTRKCNDSERVRLKTYRPTTFKPKKHSDYTKKLISIGVRARYNNGYKQVHSIETKNKISAKHRGKTISDNHKLKISNTLKGRISPMKGRSLTPEQCKAISDRTTGELNPMYGKIRGALTIEHKEKMKTTVYLNYYADINHRIIFDLVTKLSSNNPKYGRIRLFKAVLYNLPNECTISDANIRTIIHHVQIGFHYNKYYPSYT